MANLNNTDSGLTPPPAKTTSSSKSVLENVHSAPIPPPTPATLEPRTVFLKDHITNATIYPITSSAQLCDEIIETLWTEFNQELERGDTYPMEEPMTFEQYKNYWFGSFGVVMVQGRPEEHGDLSVPRGDWNQFILGTFYIKPNYPGMDSLD